MISLKNVLGTLMFALTFVLLAGPVFADSLLGSDNLNESQVIITPADSNGRLLNITVLVFQPNTTTAQGISSADQMTEWMRACAGRADRQACVDEYATAANARSRDYQFSFTSLENAHIAVEYYNPHAPDYWTPVPNCIEIVADRHITTYLPDSTGAMVPTERYYAQCDISSLVSGGNRTYIRATFVPQPGQDISSSSDTYEYNNANITTSTQFARVIQDLINGLAVSGGANQGLPGGTLPCVTLFLIMGLLLGSLYFAGKSPISLLDITTPRLPAPKGVAASGQILGPFGYTEMKRVTGRKMGADTAALATSAARLANTMRGNAEVDRLMGIVATQKGNAADRAAKGGPADVAQGRSVQRSIILAGKSVGVPNQELEALATTLPYHWGTSHHQTVSRIIDALERQGGRSSLMAMTIRDYLYSQRTFQSLETLTAHPGIPGMQRSAMHYTVTSTLGKFYGANRYALLGGLVMAGTDSAFRTARVMGRMSKAFVTEAPTLARATAKTTMQIVGGQSALERLKARAEVSPTAAWLHNQFEKHPSKIVIGQMFPINDKMAHLYRALHNEAIRDQMRYIMKLLYRKMGVRFNLSETEIANMGHIDMDILKRMNITNSAELAKLDGELRRILSSTSLSAQEKLHELMHLARNVYGVQFSAEMLTFSNRLENIAASKDEDHIKYLSLQILLEEQNKIRMSARTSGRINDEEAFFCHVGGDSLKTGREVWESMVLRTMIWDAENGYLLGGIRDEAVSARLNTVNRLCTLDPTSGMEQLPQHMRNMAQLTAVTERNRLDLVSLFDEPAHAAFQQMYKKNIASGTIAELVNFMYGGLIPRAGSIDKSGRMVWRASDQEMGLPQNYTRVDLKRHWLAKVDAQENLALGQWVESRFTRSYVPAYKLALEAELNRIPGSSSWSVEQRSQMAKKLWVRDEIFKDFENRFNSQFGKNTYGTTRETTRFYAGIVSGFLGKAMEEKGLEANHPDLMFLDKLDSTNPNHLRRLQQLLGTYKDNYNAVITRDVTYEDIAKAKRAVVMLHEGGFAYWNKGMVLSDTDRVMAGVATIRDNKGVHREFVAEDVAINVNDESLMRRFHEAKGSSDPEKWTSVVHDFVAWGNTGPYDYERKKVVAAVIAEYAQRTKDYVTFQNESAVTVRGMRESTPVAPSTLRFFGIEAHEAMPTIKLYRDMAMHMGDYISSVALLAGGELLRSSYDIIPTSSQARLHSFRLANRIESGEILQGLNDDEKAAYRAVAAQHGAYVQVWQFAIDRNPWRMGTQMGGHQAWMSFFQYGPAIPYKIKDNLRAYMDRAEYLNFVSLAGFGMNTAGNLMRPYIGMFRGMQMSMQGYASRWDVVTEDALRTYNYTNPRLLEALQAVNPLSFAWTNGPLARKFADLNIFKGSLEQHQLAGPEFTGGLKQGPQDTNAWLKGTYAVARTGDANPGETQYNYRHELTAAPAMAEYIFRTKQGNEVYMGDQRLYEAAMDNVNRRTVASEVSALNAERVRKGFGIMSNPLFGWASPVLFPFHMPMPGFPQSLSPKEAIANYVARSKGYQGAGFGASLERMGQEVAQNAANILQPHKIAQIVYCPKCGMSNFRGQQCKSCQQHLYG